MKEVVKTLLKSELISEVICVNDGSTDKSQEILEKLGKQIKLINLKKNHGKGFALASGIKRAEGKIVVFFDSDLQNLSLKHIKKMLSPILKGDCQVVLRIPYQNKTDLYRPWAISWTGERAYFKEKILPHLREIARTRYGVEIYLNSLFTKRETKIVPLYGLISPPKYIKRKPLQAVREYLQEGIEIAEAMGKREYFLPKNYFLKTKNLAEFKERIKKIKNQKMRNFLRKYLLKYVTSAKEKIREIF